MTTPPEPPRSLWQALAVLQQLRVVRHKTGIHAAGWTFTTEDDVEPLIQKINELGLICLESVISAETVHLQEEMHVQTHTRVVVEITVYHLTSGQEMSFRCSGLGRSDASALTAVRKRWPCMLALSMCRDGEPENDPSLINDTKVIPPVLRLKSTTDTGNGYATVDKVEPVARATPPTTPVPAPPPPTRNHAKRRTGTAKPEAPTTPPPPAPKPTADAPRLPPLQGATLGELRALGAQWHERLDLLGISERELQEQMGIPTKTWAELEDTPKELVLQAIKELKASKLARRTLALADIAQTVKDLHRMDEDPTPELILTTVMPYVDGAIDSLMDLSTPGLLSLLLDLQTELASSDTLFGKNNHVHSTTEDTDDE